MDSGPSGSIEIRSTYKNCLSILYKADGLRQKKEE